VGARFTAPVETGPGAHPASCTIPGGKERSGRDADPSTPSSAVVMKEWTYTSTPPMGRTACTEPQCLYKGALYLNKQMHLLVLLYEFYYMKYSVNLITVVPTVDCHYYWLLLLF